MAVSGFEAIRPNAARRGAGTQQCAKGDAMTDIDVILRSVTRDLAIYRQ